jgi:hypothetical protein
MGTNPTGCTEWERDFDPATEQPRKEVMTDRFETLKKACGGVLNPETLTEFQTAMREYEVFMSGMREMFFGPDGETDDRRAD